MQDFYDKGTDKRFPLFWMLKWYYDENWILPIQAIIKHKQVVCEKKNAVLPVFSNLSFHSRDVKVF